MEHTEKLTRYTANFIDELVISGLSDIVISPGSRSTPISVLCHAHPGLKDWILIDERSAAYFALGLAKKTQKPVALVCTSGTAAANYYPAIVEAYQARVPLIVLTADRPHELRGVGAPQTIDQIHMFGSFVKESLEMALPEATEEMLYYVRSRAAKTIRLSKQENAGPVHLNFPFREPLMPDMDLNNLWGTGGEPYNPVFEGKKRLSSDALTKLKETMVNNEKGMIVCGPQDSKEQIASLITLSEKLQIPILTDPLSQLRSGKHSKDNIVSCYDAVFRDEAIRGQLKPDYIIRFGAMPISKSYRFFVEQHKDVLQYVVEHDKDIREPVNTRSIYLFTDSTALCEDLLDQLPFKQANSWITLWKQMEQDAQLLLTADDTAHLTEGEAVRIVCEEIPNQGNLFVSNSMPVRDLDTFLLPGLKEMTVFGNRGASGIDGIISSAAGIAAGSNEHVTLIIGDLSFYHDLNGLFSIFKYKLSMTIVLINNNGGGIFSFLPQAKEANAFEALFGTPMDLDFEKVTEMYGGSFSRTSEKERFKQIYSDSCQVKGLHVIEVVTDRQENVNWHKDLWNNIMKKVARRI